MSHNPEWFESVEKKTIAKAPPFSKTLQIDKVAAGSPAANLKLRPGDKLLSVNGKAALIENIPELLAKSPSVQYRFFLPKETAFLEVKTLGLPLGIQTSPTSDGIVDQYRSKSEFEKEGLFTLWERGDYDHIKTACTLSNKRLNKGNLVGKLLGKPKSFSFTKLMSAICEIETGSAKAGYEALGEYSAAHAGAETSDVRAVLNYYHALNAKSEKQMGAYQNLMSDAFGSYSESAKITAEAVKAGIDINPTDNRIGLKLNPSHVWSVLEGGSGQQTLGDSLAALSPNQFLPLCFMSIYRGNGPYNDALLPYIAIQPFAKTRLHPLTVLTHTAEKRKDRPHWNSNEDLAKKKATPFTVLHGEHVGVIEGHNVRFAPEFVVVDKGGYVVWAGALATDFEYWEMLDQLPS